MSDIVAHKIITTRIVENFYGNYVAHNYLKLHLRCNEILLSLIKN